MAKLTGRGLATFAKSKVGTPYVYGAKGADGKLTLARLNSLKKSYPDMFTTSYYNKAKKYAQDVNELGMDYAEVDMKWYITETYRDAHRVNCLQSGNLMYCETKDAECDPLEYESSLER